MTDSIHKMDHLGMTRVSLGDLVLEESQSLEDLRARLESLPLNDFLKRYAASGGKVLLIVDGMPRWLSSNRSQQIHAGPDQPVFRVNPPRDFEQWSEVVEILVRHFNGRLGLDAYYEVWNEPNFYYLGDTEQFQRQYYYTVLGARRADPKAKVGGPSVSDFLSVGTAGAAPRSTQDKKRLLTLLLRQQFLFKQFLDYAGRTAIPELGLKRLPLDFFSWHSFYIDPTRYFGLVVPVFRKALAAAGYPESTPLINTEWNIADVPPYPEGDLNSTEVGAAFAATSLIAMRETGVERQIFQMYVDPGTDGYHGGMFTVSGIPRANFQAFRLFTQLKGKEVQTRSSDPWVKSVAFRDGNTTYLLVSTFVPTPRMISNTQKIHSALDSADLSQAMAKQGMEDLLLNGKALPEPLASEAREITERNVKAAKNDLAKVENWKSGIDIEVNLKKAPAKARHLLVDKYHSNIYADLKRAQEFLRQRARSQGGEEMIAARLKANGVDSGTSEQLLAQLRQRKSAEDALRVLPRAQQEKAKQALRLALTERRQQHMEAIREVSNWPSASLHEQSIDWPADGTLRLRAEPYSVHLFVLSDR